ncbi:FhaA domain-containing protein [Arcanobacterium canis]
MGAFERLERKVENAVDSVFSRTFRTELKPVELVSGVKKCMDDRSATMSRDRVIAPNDFIVTLSGEDCEKLTDWGEDSLRAELASAAIAYAREQRYTFLGPVRVKFASSTQLPKGKISVHGSSRRGAAAPATTTDASPENPMIDVAGERYVLTGQVTVLGRGSSADIVVNDSGVSRRHLELKITPGGVIATDLNTTNGSFVEGHRITAATLVDGNTITLGRTKIMFWTSPEAL